jgi:hypothetical protein
MSLSAAKASPKQIGAIHVLAKQAGMDDDTYRDFLEREVGVRSAADLTESTADQVLDRLRGTTTSRPIGAVAGLDSAIARKMRALWIAGYNLGVVRERTDQAMLSFLERQTGVGHTRFLRDPRTAAAAIEGLKSWIGREGRVEWPTDDRDVIANKRSVLNAQWARLTKIGAVRPGASLEAFACKARAESDWSRFERHDYDHVQRALGRKLRAALATRRQRGDVED